MASNNSRPARRGAKFCCAVRLVLLNMIMHIRPQLTTTPRGSQQMPRREDMRKVMIIGSGPIIIGQACEFDYSGTQACKALRSLGYEILLVNSNPATIMTDPGMADRTYIQPLTIESLSEIVRKERPDALLP